MCRFSVHWYCIKKVNQSDVFFIDWNYFEKSTSNWRRFFAHRNYVRVCWLNEFDFFSIKITSKKARQNNLHFSSIKIKSKKVRPNDINFLLIKINQKSRSCCVQVDMLCSLGSARVQGIVNSLFNSYNVSKRVTRRQYHFLRYWFFSYSALLSCWTTLMKIKAFMKCYKPFWSFREIYLKKKNN